MSYFGAYLPGDSTVELRPFAVPTPGHGQVLLATKYSAICGSDIRCIYHQHLGIGPERYQNVVVGHEPAGEVVHCGPGVKRFREGDRVLVYHISGCGICHDCRRGYMISCKSVHRAAYGWQRDGGMAPFMIVEEKDLVQLPDELSYADGARGFNAREGNGSRAPDWRRCESRALCVSLEPGPGDRCGCL